MPLVFLKQDGRRCTTSQHASGWTQLGHRRVMNWTMACIVLHNILHGMKENEDWLANELQKSSQEREHDSGQLQESRDQETNAEAKRAGTWRRNELRDLTAMAQDS